MSGNRRLLAIQLLAFAAVAGAFAAGFLQGWAWPIDWITRALTVAALTLVFIQWRQGMLSPWQRNPNIAWGKESAKLRRFFFWMSAAMIIWLATLAYAILRIGPGIPFLDHSDKTLLEVLAAVVFFVGLAAVVFLHIVWRAALRYRMAADAPR